MSWTEGIIGDQFSEIGMSWTEGIIGDLVRLQRGHDLTDAERKPGTVPVIGSAGQNGFHSVVRMPGPGVTMGRSGASIGKITFVKEDYWPHNTCIYVTDFKGNDPRFVAYFLQTQDLAQLNSGSAQPSLNRNFVYTVKIKFPDPATQQRIGSILSAYDDLIDNNRRRIALLEKSARLLHEEWFVRLQFPGHEHTPVVDGVPEGWAIKRLDEVAEVNARSLKSNFQGEIEYIDISAVSPGLIDGTTLYAFADAPGRARRIVRHGDIIWSCVRPNRKSYAVIWDPKPNLIASTGFAVISPLKVPSSYLLYATTSDDFVGYLNNSARGAAYPAVTAKDFEAAQLLIATHALVTMFEAICAPVLNQIKTLGLQNQKLQQARDLLLPRLMSGDLAV